MKPVIKNAPESCKCTICSFEIRKGSFAFFDQDAFAYCSKKCVREVYPDFKLGQPNETGMANLNRVQRIKRLLREAKNLKYSIDEMTNLRKAKLKEINELNKQILNEKTVEALAK